MALYFKNEAIITMSNLTRYENDQVELYINTETGESFASISGYARMADRAKSTIHERLTRSGIECKTSETLTSTGLKTVRLLNEKLIAEWIVQDNPELAKKMLQAGVRIFLQHQAGFKYEIAPANPENSLLIHYPRLKHMEMNRDTNEDILNPCTINEYLEYYQVALTPGQFKALTCRVATTYRTLTMNDPMEKRCTLNKSRSWCYEKEYQFLIGNALEVLQEGGVKRGYQLGRNARGDRKPRLYGEDTRDYK